MYCYDTPVPVCSPVNTCDCTCDQETDNTAAVIITAGVLVPLLLIETAALSVMIVIVVVLRYRIKNEKTPKKL